MDSYHEAVTSGVVQPAEVELALSRGHVRPELADALLSAPEPARTDRSSTVLELEAARLRIDELRDRQFRGRAQRALSRFSPLVRTARGRGPSSLMGTTVERSAQALRRILR
jgi:hypothetical protein